MGKHLSSAESKVRRKSKRNFTRRKQALNVREYIAGVKSDGCSICGYRKCISAIEFHHVDGEKNFELSSTSSRSLSQICDEIDKCIVVCSNCHREIHSEQIGFVNRDKSDVSDTRQLYLAFG